MEEKKENVPNMTSEEKKPKKVIKTDELEFNFFEVLILIFITALVTVTVTVTISKLDKNCPVINQYDEDVTRFIEQYKFVLDKYYGSITSKELIDNAIAGMIDGLDDPYSTYIDKDAATNFDVELEGQFYGLGVEIKQNENKQIEVVTVLVGKGAEKAGVQVGDIITHMDKESIANLSTTDFRTKMIQNNKESVTLTIVRNGESQDITIKRDLVEITSASGKVFESGKAKVGYIRLTIFANNTGSQFRKALEELESQNIDSLIIDVRSNTGGHVTTVTEILSELLDSSHVIYQEKDAKSTVKRYSTGTADKKYDIIVLIDGASASASELLASALKEQKNATLVGTKSFGKSTVQQVIDLEDGTKYKITIKEWLTSEGKVINGQGLTPDKEVNLSEKYFKDPTDENDDQLQEALSLLKK